MRAAPQNGWHQPVPTPQPRQTVRKTARHNGPNRHTPKQKSLLLRVVLALLFVAVLCLGSFVFIIYQDVNRFEDAFYEGVHVAGVHIGGMTREQAHHTMLELEQQQISQWRVALRHGESVKTMTASDIDLRLDLASLLNDAWHQGRYGTMLERWQQAAVLRNNPYQKNSDGIHFNEAKLDAILRDVQQAFDKEATDADVEFDGGFAFGQEEYGMWLDIEPIRAQVVESIFSLSSTSIMLQPQTIAPEVTLDDLKGQNAQIVSVSTPIVRSSATAEFEEGRTHNVRLACERLNGFQLNPGRTLSFNNVVGRRTTRNGFREALEIAQGEYVVGIGGGVCQVSTTLYQAALRAGLKVETRSPHAIPSPYAEKGQDATVTDNGRDLVIRNTGDTPVYIMVRLEETKNEKRCIVEIHGRPLPDGIRLTLESRQVGLDIQPDPPVKYIRDTKGVHVTYVGQEKEVFKGRVGYKVETYLVTKRSDGMEIGRELLTTDIYPAKSAEIYTGVTHRGVD